jgi:rare lipoprotein A
MLSVPASALALSGPASDTNANTAAPEPQAGKGQRSPSSTGTGARRTIKVISQSHNVLDGRSVLIRGRVLPADAGRRVRLQGHFAEGWRTVAGSRTGAAGGFRLRFKPDGGLQRHLRVQLDGTPASTPAGSVTVYTASVASWYDDGGNTACGFHAGLGVANVSLPCGTKVRLRYGGRTVTATVDDRGPYVGGRTWDLNQGTAAALGFAGVGMIWSSR